MKEIGDRISFSPDGHWLWHGPVDRKGYPVVSIGRARFAVARLVFRLFRGKVMRQKQVVVTCGEPLCVRPDHLALASIREIVTSSESAAGRNRRKTHCPAGHPYDRANTARAANGSRRCRACQRERWRAKGSEARRRRRVAGKAVG